MLRHWLMAIDRAATEGRPYIYTENNLILLS